MICCPPTSLSGCKPGILERIIVISILHFCIHCIIISLVPVGGSNCYFVPPTIFNTTLNYSGSSVLFLKSKQTTNLICVSSDSLVLVPVAVTVYTLTLKCIRVILPASQVTSAKFQPLQFNLQALAKSSSCSYMRNLQHGRCYCHPSPDHSPFPRATLVATVLFVTRPACSAKCANCLFFFHHQRRSAVHASYVDGIIHKNVII